MRLQNAGRACGPLLLILTFCNTGAADDSLVVQEHPMQAHFEQVQQLLSESDSFAAIQYIQGQGDPSTVVESYRQTALWLYNEQKDVPAMVVISRAGIQYGLTVAAKMQRDDPAAANTLRGQAKTIAFNQLESVFDFFSNAA